MTKTKIEALLKEFDEFVHQSTLDGISIEEVYKMIKEWITKAYHQGELANHLKWKKWIEKLKGIYLIETIGIKCKCGRINEKHIVPSEGVYLNKSDILSLLTKEGV